MPLGVGVGGRQLTRYLAVLASDRVPVQIQVHDRRDLRRLERRLDLLRVADNDDGQVVRVDVLPAPRGPRRLSSPPSPTRRRSEVVLGQILHVQAADGVADASDAAEALRQALDQRVLRRFHFLVGHRPRAADAAISFMNSVRAASLLAVMMSPPAWNGPGPRPNCEVRSDAVAVALLLADVRVEPRLEQLAEHRVHHPQREEVGCLARRAHFAELETRLRGAGLIHQVDRRGRRCGWSGVVERHAGIGRSRPRPEHAFDDPLDLVGLDVANHRDDRAVRFEELLVERQHVVTRDRLDGGLRGGPSVRMRR